MNRGHSNVIPFGRRPAPTPAPVMMRCPVSASLDISEAIALMWQLREQIQDASGLRQRQRASLDRLGSSIEDHLESALHSMEQLP